MTKPDGAPDEPMRAMCPHCGGDGCDKPNCVDGYLQVSFAEGDWFTRQCINMVDCGFTNGGCITKDGFPSEPSEPCVICNGPTDWIRFEDAPEDSGEGHTRNYDKFAIKSLDGMVERLREILKKTKETVAGWEEVKNRNLTIEEARLIGVCIVCRESSNPTKEKGSFHNKEWAHDKCRKN